MLTSELHHSHPAILAWQSLGFAANGSLWVTTVREKDVDAVFFIHGLLSNDRVVVAKRSPVAKATVERTIYEDVLPHLSSPKPEYYGFVLDNNGDAWLFVEQVDGERFTASDPEHRYMAACWLANLHLTAASLDLSLRLPDKSINAYRRLLTSTRERVDRGCRNPALDAAMRSQLQAWNSQLDLLDEQWRMLHDLCIDAPVTVMHGDFARKNMFVIPGHGGLLVFDWGTAGWGPPSADLPQNVEGEDYWAGPDLDVYRDIISDRWPRIEVEYLHGLAAVGKVIRSLTALHGDAKVLSTPWAEKVVYKIPPYFGHLDSAIATLGLSSQVDVTSSGLSRDR